MFRAYCFLSKEEYRIFCFDFQVQQFKSRGIGNRHTANKKQHQHKRTETALESVWRFRVQTVVEPVDLLTMPKQSGVLPTVSDFVSLGN
jgi:hypothetical protein